MTRNESALQDVVHAARKAGPDSARVLFEALRRDLNDEECSEILDALQAIWNAEPAGAWEDDCPHYAAKTHLAQSARDVVSGWHELATAPSYRISADTSVTGYCASFRSVRAPQHKVAAE